MAFTNKSGLLLILEDDRKFVMCFAQMRVWQETYYFQKLDNNWKEPKPLTVIDGILCDAGGFNRPVRDEIQRLYNQWLAKLIVEVE